MSDDLAAYLGSIDRRLLSYLDGDRQLSDAAARHLQRYAVALLQGLISAEHVAEDWGDFFDLADGFVIAHGSARLEQLSCRAMLLDTYERSPSRPLDTLDRLFLAALVCELDAYATGRGRRDRDPTVS